MHAVRCLPSSIDARCFAQQQPEPASQALCDEAPAHNSPMEAASALSLGKEVGITG